MLLYNAQEPTDFESYQEQGDVGFTNVAGAQIDTFIYEDLSNSRERNLDAELWKEVYKVHDLAPEMFGPKSVPQTNPNAPKILQQAWNDTAQAQNAARLSDWESMIEPNLEALKSRFPESNIRNRDEIDTDIAAQAKVMRDKFEKTYSYADPYAAFFGTLGGAAVASMADPINIMTLPLGGGKVAGASFIKGMGIVVARGFGIGVVTETALQPFVYDYKKEIESPYDLQDALFNMAAAGVGNGLLNGVGHSIARGFDKIVGKQELPDTHETRKLRKDIQALLELQTFADETGAKTVGELEIHLKALNTAMADIEAGRQVDYDSLGKTIEAEYLELFDVEVDGARATMDYIAQKRYQLEESFDPELYAKQEQLQKFADQKLTKWELKQAQNKADVETTGELNQETDLDAIREIQKADFDRSVGEDTIRQNEEANIANNDLRASRRDEGDMIALKQQMDDLDTQYSEQVDYHSAAKKARDQYVVDKVEETNQAIDVAPTDTPRMIAVKTAVNRIAASMGANDIKVRVYEGNPELDGDMRFSMDDGEGSAAWKAAEAKGLDMSQEGRMARAKAMGFDTDNVVYHATTKNFNGFSLNKAGSSTGAKDAMQGVWFADSPIATKYFGGYDDQIPTPEYSDYILSMASERKNLEGMRDRGEISASEYFRQGRDYRAASSAEPQNKFTEGYESGSQIIPSMVRGRLKEVDASNYSPDRFLDIAKSAKSEGYDGVKFNNINDMDEAPVRHSQTLIFDPSNIRSVNAAFDPDLIDSPNLRYSLADGGVSTRVPTAKASTEDALTEDLLVGADVDLADPITLAKNTEKINEYDGYIPKAANETPEEIAINFIDQVKQNLLWLHDLVPDDIRKRSHMWYTGANRITEGFAARYGYTNEQSAGVMAVLSPQKDWYMNASLGERVMDTYTNHQDTLWSSEMDLVASDATPTKVGKVMLPKGILARNDKNIEVLKSIQGKALKDLDDDIQIAAWIRVFDEAHNKRSHRIVTPEGGFIEFATTKNGSEKITGWGSFSEIAKAVSVLRDGSPKNVSDQMGAMHKVRNFYNNILLPDSPNGHVTIDTHAVAAGLIKPLSGNHTEVSHNFGTGAASSSRTGSKGTYGLYAEAYRQAASERGILARQMQSITWEAVRGMFSPAFKGSAKNQKLISDFWQSHKSGKISLDEVRQEILDAADGIEDPSWHRSSGDVADKEWSSSYKGDLPTGGISRNSELEAATGRGVGIDAARGDTSLDSSDVRYSRDGQTIEAAINPETGELHINASAFRDEAHLMQVMREEIIGHYGLRKSLGDEFQGVINDIKSTALTNPELRQMWLDLSGVDPQTKQVINPNAPYRNMADDVIADEIISKMAREEVSDTTFMALKNIIIKALRKIGLIKDDITISEMRALVVKSEQSLKKNAVKQPRITGIKPQLKQIDEPLNNEAIDAEAARIVSDETTDQVIFDQNGNTINLRDALMEDDNDIAGIESLKVCML